MRRVIAPFGPCILVLALTLGVQAQVNPPVTPPPGTVNPPSTPVAPSAPAAPLPAGETASPATPAAAPTGITPSGIAPSAAPSGTPLPSAPTPTPTPVPLIVDPPTLAVEPGHTVQARVGGSYGTIVVTSADPAVATVTADQNQRAVVVTGVSVGTTTVTVKDDRGTVTRDVPVRVAYAAGTAADRTAIRVTGNPATVTFLRDAAAYAAQHVAVLRPGASIAISPDAIDTHGNLGIDDRIGVDVPLQIAGTGYLPVSATTHVDVENFALPRIRAARLLVSDFPETLKANGVLFTADLDRTSAQRFLYYHYNPAAQPGRRILLKVTNPAPQPAMLQFISGSAGPGANEMEIGHLSTQRFLVRELQNEGTVVTIPPNTTINLIDHPLPPGSIVSALLQLREVEGDPLHLTLVAQDAGAPLDQSVDTTQVLAGDVRHARGEYQVPEFFFDYTYAVDGDNLEIPIGQLPLPNLRIGEALAGDYGVQQTVTVTIVNSTRSAQPVAIYANPRGGRATGTFLIDRTLVQTHALAAFSKYKIWQETIRPKTFRRVQVVTMPEGGSSYPLRLIFAPDDGSTPPGAPGSPVY